MSLQDLASNETIQQDQNIEDSDQNELFQPIQINTNNEPPNNEGKDLGFSGRNDFLVAPKAKETFQTLKYFGYDYFYNQPQSYSPISDIAIPPDYVLGPGDEIIFNSLNLGRAGSTYKTRSSSINKSIWE